MVSSLYDGARLLRAIVRLRAESTAGDLGTRVRKKETVQAKREKVWSRADPQVMARVGSTLTEG